MEPFGNLLGNQGSVATGAVVDDEIDLNLVAHGYVYDFCRRHQTLRVTPAMEAGVADHVWGIEEIIYLL